MTPDAPPPQQQVPEELELVRAGLEPDGRTSRVGFFLLSLVLFVVASGWSSPLELARLLVILAVHEAGHALAMWGFGYRDVRVFFVPFMGAAAAGTTTTAQGWQRGVVLLAGPLPGILVGLGVAIAAFVAPVPWLSEAAFMAVVVNALNLLPIGPLDGGRLFQLALFSRLPLVEKAFLGIGVLALLATALLGEWVLAVWGVLLGFGLPRRFRTIDAARALRAQEASLPTSPAALDEPQLRAISAAARAVGGDDPAAHLRALPEVWQRVHERPPGGLGTTLLLGGWGGGLVLALIAAVLLLATRGAPSEARATPPSAID